ncbi:putative bifunctional diguanylate cyclase/phosphodiesterase [Novosphingobium sediminicola]|uniref:Two-component system CheB/CheR fusion protein n=1 Tax=Novosphingobium sediminicola TaxID=563162 RepID=A0A7W6G7R4_9SPHN|nr:EAL domain-containing protein [Novosphingobium sediminicola]MBB3956455.1 two-component system CheB/CheR fusion protein [Novosphingobium sediminicola]
MAWSNPLLGRERGLNSIPWRFALMALVTSAVVALVARVWLAGPWSAGMVSALAALLMLPATVSYLAARKLSGMIRTLRDSTQAIVEGDLSRPIDIDCACEVGGLADSFRAMVARLNHNMLRMNVLAYTDPITGLPNRSVITHILSLGQRDSDKPCAGAMLFIDLDGFKRVNDTLGHDAGDELLRQVAARIIVRGMGLALEELETCTNSFGELCETCPTRPVFARFAGDEFVLLLPGHHDNKVLDTVARSIHKALAECFTVFNNEVFIGASMGIARMPEDADTPEQLLAYADIAMYRAKEGGKNTHVFFDSSLKGKVEERALIERELHHAIEHDTLELHYQPKFDADTLNVTGVEALARWNCPGLGPVSPEIFVNIAEQCGLMVPLGHSILRSAMRQARQWLDAGRPLPIAVNVSPVQFERPGFVESVLAMLDHFGLPPQWLELEITESIAMADFARTRERVDTLRKAGISISIDDFGIGYSNLSQLARLDYDALKIDRSLVGSIGEHGKTESMLAAIITVSKVLGHKVIAEGIESPEQMAYLKARGCREFQGFHLARPMPAGELAIWLNQRGQSTLHAIREQAFERLRA